MIFFRPRLISCSILPLPRPRPVKKSSVSDRIFVPSPKEEMVLLTPGSWIEPLSQALLDVDVLRDLDETDQPVLNEKRVEFLAVAPRIVIAGLLQGDVHEAVNFDDFANDVGFVPEFNAGRLAEAHLQDDDQGVVHKVDLLGRRHDDSGV